MWQLKGKLREICSIMMLGRDFTSSQEHLMDVSGVNFSVLNSGRPKQVSLFLLDLIKIVVFLCPQHICSSVAL